MSMAAGMKKQDIKNVLDSNLTEVKDEIKETIAEIIVEMANSYIKENKPKTYATAMMPRGKWTLKKVGYKQYDLCCSNCGKVIYGFGMAEEEALEVMSRESKEHKDDVSPDFCSRCGADMR